ncbi:MAG TPA: serine/threonine-protein kinase [Fimbriimonadaceae bacterium]|nr:serine/threonine-protein kinase [Fimbriimonadaceae bacterium]
MSNTPPTTLGKYQIIREIARSNDIVYEAYDPLMNRRVALKELAVPHGSTQQQREERVKRFLREAKAAGSLSHPNIMTVYEVGDEAGRYFIAMEFLDGHTLRNELDTRGHLPPERALEVTKAVLEGLDFAHKSGVVHRDIKPENIQLLTDGRIKLTDFGIARLTFEPNLTMDGQVFGTPSYMSPEQVVGREIDARSDLFSVGIVLHEMLAGAKPFSGDSVVSITYAIMNSEPQQPQGVSYALWQVIAKALDKSPALRFSNAREMISALDEASRAATSASMVLDPNPYVQPPPAGGNPYLQPYGSNPYTTPYGAVQPPPVAPPIQYPYNPYQSQPSGGTVQPPPIQPTTIPPGYAPQVPIYYPPPPRQPLLKPETKRFLGRLFLTVMIMGTLFALVIVGINSISVAIDRLNKQNQDKRIQAELAATARMPLAERIKRYEESIDLMQSQESRVAAQRDLAVLYERQGQIYLERLKAARHHQAVWDASTRAQGSFQKAVELHPTNPLYYDDLGAVLALTAEKLPEPEQRKQAWSDAAYQWNQAYLRARTEEQRIRFGERAASAYHQLAYAMATSGDFYGAREQLRYALTLVAPGTDLAQRMRQDLERW